MCGIGGIFSFKKFKNKKEVLKVATALLIANESRGEHATGVAVINTYADYFLVLKNDKRARHFVKTDAFKNLILNNEYNVVLLHTRNATHGEPKFNVNNHPIFNKENNDCLIHNGIIRNYEQLKLNKNFHLEGDCDSEIILSVFNAREHNIYKTIKQISGTMAFALYHQKKLYLYKDSNPLYLIYNKNDDFFIFSSLKYSITELYKSRNFIFRIFETSEKELVNAEISDEDLITIDFSKRTFSKEKVKSKSFSYTTITENTTSNFSSDKNTIQTSLADENLIEYCDECGLSKAFCDCNDKTFNNNRIHNQIKTDEEIQYAEGYEKFGSKLIGGRFFNNHNHKNHKGGFRK